MGGRTGDWCTLGSQAGLHVCGHPAGLSLGLPQTLSCLPQPRCRLPAPPLRAPPQVYLPNAGHPAAGVLRTYVKDSTDVAATMGASTWLDSGRWLAGWAKWCGGGGWVGRLAARAAVLEPAAMAWLRF